MSSAFKSHPTLTFIQERGPCLLPDDLSLIYHVFGRTANPVRLTSAMRAWGINLLIKKKTKSVEFQQRLCQVGLQDGL